MKKYKKAASLTFVFLAIFVLIIMLIVPGNQTIFPSAQEDGSDKMMSASVSGNDCTSPDELLEAPVKSSVEESVEDSVEKSVENSVEDFVEDFVEDSVEESVEDPMEDSSVETVHTSETLTYDGDILSVKMNVSGEVPAESQDVGLEIGEVTDANAGSDAESVEVTGITGCQVTMEATLSEELTEQLGNEVGLMSVTINPLGAEPAEYLVASGDMENESPVMGLSYQAPDSMPVTYTATARTVRQLVLESTQPYDYWVDVYAGQTLTIDLNGYVWTRNTDTEGPLVYVHSGGRLEIIDSKGGGGIQISNAQALFTMFCDNPDLDEPEIMIDVGNDILTNDGGKRVIFGQQTRWDYSVYDGLVGNVELKSGILQITSKADGDRHVIFANNVIMSGGEIRSGLGTNGAGIYAGTVKMSGGTIKDCVASMSGGGIYARQVHFSGGTIEGNTANWSGGGIYTMSLVMEGGIVKGNNATDGQGGARGGAGIYLSRPQSDIDYVTQNEEGVAFNCRITGGNILNNVSERVGGGLFIDVGARAIVHGEHGRIVNIKGNRADDAGYTWGSDGGHGFGGGGIFVEHEFYDSGHDAMDGGWVIISDAIITNNTAHHGGGVAGCGSANVQVAMGGGAAIFGNTAIPSKLASNYKYMTVCNDMYVDGDGKVDSLLPGNIQGSWHGVDHTGSAVNILEGTHDFSGGFYLTHGDEIKEHEQWFRDISTVFIEDNTSGSGGGGVGGNGFIQFGIIHQDERPEEGYLILQKTLEEGYESMDAFQFTIALENADGSPLTGAVLDADQSSEDTILTETDTPGKYEIMLHTDEQAAIKMELGSGFHIREEIPNIIDPPLITSTVGVATDGDSMGVSGVLDTTLFITFMNKEQDGPMMPVTGSTDRLMLIGCALMLLLSSLLLILLLYVRKQDI